MLKWLRRKKAAGVPVSAFQNERKQRQRQARFRKVTAVFSKRWKLIIIFFFITIILSAVVGIIYFLQRSEVLKINDIYVIGNNKIIEDEVVEQVSYLIGKSLFSFDATQVEHELQQQFPYLRRAYIRKILPDTVEIEVVERFPELVYVNMAGALAVDEDQVVIQVLAADEVAPLSKDELLILDGYGDPESTRVKDKYLSKIEDEEERKKVKWEEVPIGDKRPVLAELREDYRVRVQGQLKQYLDLVALEDLADVPILQEVGIELYQEGDSFDQERYLIAQAIHTYVADREIPINRLLWQTEFNIIVELTTGTRLIFSSSKSIDEQLIALETIRQVEDLTRVQSVDLRSNFVAVK
jgi:hypothetical protein